MSYNVAVSLKRELDDPNAPIRRFLDRRLPYWGAARAPWGAALRQVRPLVPATPKDGTAVPTAALGHAIVLRASWMFGPLTLGSLADGASLLADHGADREVLDGVLEILAAWVPEDRRRAAAVSWYAGLMDRAQRTGRGDDPTTAAMVGIDGLDDLLAAVPAPWVADISAVARLAEDALESLADPSARVRVPMPGCAAFGGAEADLIASGTLVDLSATASSKARARDLEQLVVLALLDADDTLGLTDVAVAPLRFGALVQWDLDGLLSELAGSDVGLADIRGDLAEHLGG